MVHPHYYRKPLRHVKKILDLDPPKKIPTESKSFLFSCKKRNFKAGPGSRWQIFAKIATFQLDKWTRVQWRIFYIFLTKMKIVRFLKRFNVRLWTVVFYNLDPGPGEKINFTHQKNFQRSRSKVFLDLNRRQASRLDGKSGVFR